MSALLSSIAGGGGSFLIEDRVTGTIASGVTGDILSINVPGKIIRLYLLVCSAASTQTGISITRDGFLIADQEELAQTQPAGSQMVVSRNLGVGPQAATGRYFKVIDGETIVINKNTGNTAQNIAYAYEVGEFK